MADSCGEAPDYARKSRPYLMLHLLAFFLGFGCALIAASVLEKADLMWGETRLARVESLVDTVRDIGLDHFRSCESKIEKLHGILVSFKADDAAETGKIVASIVIDGKNCNKYLVRNIESQVPLGRIPFLGDFKDRNLPGQELPPELKNEQGLVLWLLHRINHEQLLYSPHYVTLFQNVGEDYVRKVLVENWKHCCG